MQKLRYNRIFKQGIFALLLCTLLCVVIITTFIVSKIQYNMLVSDMKSIEATVVDIDLDMHIKGPDIQNVDIEYVVDGVTYKRDLGTDTKVSFDAGSAAHYSVGDKVQIFYDPQNPEIIASPRSVKVGYAYLIVMVPSLLFFLFLLGFLIKKRHKFLVTQEEYDKERADRKKRKTDKKQRKNSK